MKREAKRIQDQNYKNFKSIATAKPSVGLRAADLKKQFQNNMKLMKQMSINKAANHY